MTIDPVTGVVSWAEPTAVGSPHTITIRAENTGGADTESWLLTVGVSCPCDWTPDGFLNSQDFFDFLREFFDNNADYNNDGATNSQDLFDFLQCFFTGCP